MSRSEVDFRGQEFAASDSVLQVLLKLVLEAAAELEKQPPWLVELRVDWLEQATHDFGFGVVLDLDRWITDDERREVLLDLARKVENRVAEFGDPVPAEALNALGVGDQAQPFESAVPSEVLARPAAALVTLLGGPAR